MSITNKDRLLPNEERGPHMNHSLTKRERFAMAAMQGILANGLHFDKKGLEDQANAPRCVAEDAVITADALLKELNK